MKNLLFFILPVLLLASELSQAQESYEIPMGKRQRQAPNGAERLADGVMLLANNELILLDDNFQVRHRAFIDVDVEGQRVTRRYLGLRQTPTQYILHFEVSGVKSFEDVRFREIIEVVLVHKETFEQKRQYHFPYFERYRPIRHFVLENDFFSFAVNIEQKKLRILRSFGGEHIHAYTFDLDRRLWREIVDFTMMPISANKSPNGETSSPTSVWGTPLDVSNSLSRLRTYLDSERELMLTIDRKDLMIYRFKMDPTRPGAGEITSQTVYRPLARELGHIQNSYIYDNHLYILIKGPEAVMLDVFKLGTMEPIASLSSVATDSSKSIKPHTLVEENVESWNHNILTDEERIRRIVARGATGFIVTEKAQYLEVTIGFYGDIVRNPRHYYYRVMLDKTTFKSLGSPSTYERTHALRKYVLENRMQKNISPYTNLTYFRKEGADYFGHQHRREMKYVFKKIAPD